VELEIPPLRNRTEDLPTLIGSILRYLVGGVGTHDVDGIEEEAVEVLLRHTWPGNVRELINTLERAVLVCRGSMIGVNDLPRDVIAPAEPGESDALGKLPERLLEQPWAAVREEVLAKTERAYLDAVLRAAGGVIKDAAEQAGISPRSLYDKMKRHDLDKDDYR
jgi:DNA-binding NtrC family response regulator